MPVYKDKKRNTWYVSTYVEYRDGTRKRVMKRGFRTKREATRYENELMVDSSMSSSFNPTLKEVTDEYLAIYKQTKKATSYRKAESVARLRILPHLGNKRVQDITKRDVVLFQNKMLGKYTVSGAKRAHTNLSTILNYAIKMEYINVNVAREVGNIQAKVEKQMNYWTVEQFIYFIRHVDDLQYKAFFMCLFWGGFRKGELLAITWKDVDFKNNTIDINKTATRNDITTPKNESSVRALLMPLHTMNLLRQIKLQRNIKDDYFVFGSYYRHIHESTIDRKYAKYIKKSKATRIRIHDFRHSHATYLINNGYDIQIVSKRLGHSNISTTYDIYAHLYPNKETEAIKQMEKDFETNNVIQLMK